MLRVSKFEHKLDNLILTGHIWSNSVCLIILRKNDQSGSSMGFLISSLIIILLFVQTTEYDQHMEYDQNLPI